MNPASHRELSSTHPGKARNRLAASHSRPGPSPAARLAVPRPAERAPDANFLALQLAFDSHREPAAAGHRGPRSNDRRMVYMSRDYAVDVSFEPRGDTSDVLRGELLSRSDGPIAEVPAFLLEGEKIAGYDRTGSLGQFRLETREAPDLRLCLLLAADRCIDLPLDLGPVRRSAPEA